MASARCSSGTTRTGSCAMRAKVGTGFDDAMLRKLTPELVKRRRTNRPSRIRREATGGQGVHWLRRARRRDRVHRMDRDGALRHPSFQGLRPDKKATEVVRERPGDDAPSATSAPDARDWKAPAGKKASANKGRKSREWREQAFQGQGRHGALNARRHRHLASGHALAFRSGHHQRRSCAVLRGRRGSPAAHIANRPLSLVRCPTAGGQCFHQKNADRAVNAAVARIEVPRARARPQPTWVPSPRPRWRARAVGRDRDASMGRGARADRPSRPADLRLRPRPGGPVERARHGGDVAAHAPRRSGARVVPQDDGGKGPHRRAPGASDPVVGRRQVVHALGGRAHGAHVPRSLRRDDRQVQAQGQDPHRLLSQRRRCDGRRPYAVRSRAPARRSRCRSTGPSSTRTCARRTSTSGNAARTARLDEDDDPWADFFTVRQSITAAIRKRFA